MELTPALQEEFDIVVRRNPGEAEFHQAAREVLESLGPVVAIEQRGHGHTADRAGPAFMDEMVKDTAAVLRHLGVAKAHIVGHSMGAMIGFGLAIAYPQFVASRRLHGHAVMVERFAVTPSVVAVDRTLHARG